MITDRSIEFFSHAEMMEGVCALLLLSLLRPAGGDLNAGFMRDFFTRFPHFPAFSMFQVSSEIQNLEKNILILKNTVVMFHKNCRK
jgi:hypothetical protein